MGILGNAGNLYMTILILLLTLGFGLSGLWLLDYVVDSFGKNGKSKSNRKNPNLKVK